MEKGERDFRYIPLFSIYLKMVGHAVIREDATKDVTIVTVVPNTIFTSFDILRDLPRNGYLTRAENHRHPLPLESISTRAKRRENIVIICLSDGWPDIVSRSILLLPPFSSFFFFRDRKFFRYLASFMIALCVFYILQMYNMHDVTILNFIQRNWRFLFEKKSVESRNFIIYFIFALFVSQWKFR